MLGGLSSEWLNRTALTWATSLGCFALLWRSQELAADKPLMAGVFPLTSSGAFLLWGAVVGAYLGIKTLNDRAQAKLDRLTDTTPAPAPAPQPAQSLTTIQTTQPVTVTSQPGQPDNSNAQTP